MKIPEKLIIVIDNYHEMSAFASLAEAEENGAIRSGYKVVEYKVTGKPLKAKVTLQA